MSFVNFRELRDEGTVRLGRSSKRKSRQAVALGSGPSRSSHSHAEVAANSSVALSVDSGIPGGLPFERLLLLDCAPVAVRRSGGHVGKERRQKGTQKKRKGTSGILGWIMLGAVVLALGYGLTQMSSVAFDEDDIKVVNFQGLTSKQKQRAL